MSKGIELTRPNGAEMWRVPAGPMTMSLREYYAGMAMQAAIANEELLQRIDDGDKGAMRFCVGWADALIAALQEET